jgi:hypothetical protein
MNFLTSQIKIKIISKNLELKIFSEITHNQQDKL